MGFDLAALVLALGSAQHGKAMEKGLTGDGDAADESPTGDLPSPGNVACFLDTGPHLSPPLRLLLLVGSQKPVS